MTIITRAGKNSALTHNELDGNFTDLDGRLTALGATNLTDTTANLNIASLISIGPDYDSNRLQRTADSGEGTTDLVSLLVKTDYATESHNLADSQSAGIFAMIDTANKSAVWGGAVKWMVDNVTDTNNFNTNIELSCYDTVSGSASEVRYTLEPKKAVFPGALKLEPTAYADLPANSGSGDDGMIAYLTSDGGGTNRFQLIYSVGGIWRYVTDGTVVASS